MIHLRKPRDVRREPANDRLNTPPECLELVREVGPIIFDPFPGEYSLTLPKIRLPREYDTFADAEAGGG